jgi:hypothetical protein
MSGKLFLVQCLIRYEAKHIARLAERERYFYQNASGGSQIQSKAIVTPPIFEISWGSIPLGGRPEYSLPAATMTTFGPTEELIEYICSMML